MARMLRSHLSIAYDNVVLWHERDISHSSTERLYLPDNFGILHYALVRLCGIVENLVVSTDVIEKRVEDEGSYLSSYYLHRLIEQTDLAREELYAVVQEAAFRSSPAAPEVFHRQLVRLLGDRGIDAELPLVSSLGDIKRVYLGAAEDIFHRIIEEYPPPT